ncbi:MAG: type VI secretion protein IcmF/TssM N-terminal domain-containing protein [Thermoanaerobaculia bacterium]
MDLLSPLTRHLPLTLAVLALLVLAIVTALVLLARRKRVKPAAEEPDEALAPAPAPAGAVVVDFRHAGSHQRLAGAFRRALAELRRHLGAGDSRYRLPWYVLLGEEAAGKADLFPDSGLNLPLGAPEEPAPGKGDGCAFWFFDRGVVLDVSGEYVLGSAGRTPNERGWRHFLSLLRENRPERPLDGVILAIPCAELAGPPGEEGARLAAAAEKGETLFRRLRQAQEMLGMSFPIYVLVTGCESVPGFESYVAEVPEHLRGDLFGWSSPYAPETAYHPEWLDEAFGLLGASLHRAQIEAFGDQAVLEDPDGVFCFPEELQRLRVPLRAYLNQVFRASAYHELLPCRGIYFCGRLSEGAQGASLLRDPGTVGGSVFVRDVLDRKVFPEHDLARPTSLALLQGGRRLRVLQAAVVTLALISTLGLWWGAHHLRSRKQDLRVFLLSTAQDLEETRQRRLNGAAEHTFLHEKAFRLFEGMSRIDADWFGSAFIPSSWVSPFNRDLTQAIVRAYNEIILKTLYQELGRALDRVLAASRPVGLAASLVPAPDAPAGAAAPGDRFIAWDPAAGGQTGSQLEPLDLRPVERAPEFTRLNGYVSSLRELESNVGLYNRLRVTENLQDLNAVVQYLFGRELPKGFFHSSELYERALADVEYTRYRPLDQRPRTTRQASELGGALFDQLFARNAAMAELRRSAALVEQVAGAAWDPAGGDTVASLIELRTRLRRADEALASPDLAWMSAESFDPGPSWQPLLQGVRATIFLGPDTADALQQEGAQRFQDFRRALLAVETRSTGPLVLRETKSGRLGLSPQAKLLADALDGLSQQGFVAAAAAQGPAATSLAPRGRVIWDALVLQQAAGLYKPYEGFIEKILAPFPPDLRNALQISARDRLGARMMGEVAEAQQAGPEPDLASALLVEQALDAEVANFQAAAGPIAELSDRFARLGLLADRDQVAAAFTAQGAQILADADRLLALRAPYTPRGGGFDWWKGGKRPALEAYAARDEAELAAYLAAQRNEVADIAAHYAGPVIQALGGKAASRPLRAAISRWTALGEQLRRYAAKEPGSSVAGLEDFIARDLTEIEPASCTRHINNRVLAEPAADFFLERRAALRRQVWDRCLYLAGGQAAEGYRKLADFFNQRLAGKFPFAAALPGRLDAEADPQDVRSFFQLWAVYAPIVRAVPEADRPPGTGEFVDRMDAVRALFAAFLDDPAHPEAPSFDLNVRFRENRRGEKGADQILRWSLASGEQAVSHPNVRPALPWTYGAPIRVELQWAKDSPVVPVESAGLPGVHVRERTAVQEWRGHWALFALARALTDPAIPADPGVQVLRVEVATRPEADPQAKPDPARVYVALTLRAPERREKTAGKDAAAASPAALPVPAGDLELPAFPTAAPAWKAQAKAEMEAP